MKTGTCGQEGDAALQTVGGLQGGDSGARAGREGAEVGAERDAKRAAGESRWRMNLGQDEGAHCLGLGLSVWRAPLLGQSVSRILLLGQSTNKMASLGACVPGVGVENCRGVTGLGAEEPGGVKSVVCFRGGG